MSDLRFERVVGRLAGSIVYDANSVPEIDGDAEDGIQVEEAGDP